jgi:hypothetical protein
MNIGDYDICLGDKKLRILLADWQEHLTSENLAEQLWTEHRQELTVIDCLIIRPPVDHPVLDVAPIVEALSPVFRRVEKRPVYLLTSHAFHHSLSGNVHSGVDDLLTIEQRNDLLPLLRQTELASIAILSNAILKAEGPTMFRAPSKEYCKQFFRAGNVQKHRGTVDAFFFWMLPWLKNCHALVADTWTISSIALNTSRLLARYAPELGRCKVDMLAEYLDGSPEAESAADAVFNRVLHGTAGVVLTLFSACMTGGAAGRLLALTDRHECSNVIFRFGALYNLNSNLPIECLCELFKECEPECFAHSKELTDREVHVIDIDKTIYFPTVTKETVVDIDDPVAKPAKAFFAEYGTAGAFFVHRDSHVAGKPFRHHAIYPDLLVLMKVERFKVAFRKVLAQLDTVPALVITPPHEAGKAMADFACTFLTTLRDLPVRQWQHLDLVFPREPEPSDDELKQVLHQMNHQSSILILDDVSVSGDRLDRYSKSLRDLEFKGQIHYMVGLARPVRQSKWDKLKRNLQYRDGHAKKHTLGYVEFLLLPDWDSDRCPWCIEHKLYERMLEHGELPLVLASRSYAINTQGAALVPYPHDFEFQLTQNSIFAPQGTPQGSVIAAIMSGLQQLRTDPSRTFALGRQSYPSITCLNPIDYLGGTFSDPVLRAAILRSARRSEVEHIGSEQEQLRAAMAKKLIMSAKPDERAVSIELLIAMACRKIPKLSFTDDELKELDAIGLGEVLRAVESTLR